MNKDNQEIEIKIKLDDRAALERKVIELGGQKIFEGAESDIIFNNEANEFSSGNDGGRHLRLRKSTSGNFLTYKENISGEKSSKYLQERIEIETQVTDYEKTKIILEKIGFTPVNQKQKKYSKYKYQGLVLEFHTMPFLGEYLEIEGTKEELEKILPLLDLKITQGIAQGYFPLFQKYLKDHKLHSDTPFTFESEANLQK